MTPSRIGLLVSLALHATLLVAVSWWWFAPHHAPAKGQLVPVSLSMFDAPPAPTQSAAQTAPLPAKKLAAVDAPPAPPKSVAPPPEPVKPPPSVPQPAPPTPKVKPAPKPTPKPTSKPAKPRPEPREKPPKPKPLPSHTEHKPAPVHHPKPQPEPVSKPHPKVSRHKPVQAKPEASVAASSPSTAAQTQQTKPAQAEPPAGASTSKPKADLTQLQLQYQSALSEAINRQKFYPRLAQRLRQEGQVTVAFTVLANGRIQAVRVVGSSGMPLLDQGAVEAIRRVGQFRPIPPALGMSRMSLRIVLNYKLR